MIDQFCKGNTLDISFLYHPSYQMYHTGLSILSVVRVNRETKKTDSKLNIKKTKIMVSSSISSRQIKGGKAEVVTDFIFLGSKLTVDGDCSHEITRFLLLGRKGKTNLDSVLNSRDITLKTNVCIDRVWFFQ